VDLEPLTDHLAALARSRPNAESRAQVEQALFSKWDGVRVAATKVLCAWGDDASVSQAKEAVAKLSSKEARWANAGAMAEAIAPHLRASDAEWVVATLSRVAHVENVVSLRVLTDGVVRAQVLPVLQRAVQSESNDRRRRVLSQVLEYAHNRHAQREV
jgi:hypothetical protein